MVKGSGYRRGEGEWRQMGWRGVKTEKVKGSGDRGGEGEWRHMVKGSGDKRGGGGVETDWMEGEWRQAGLDG